MNVRTVCCAAAVSGFAMSLAAAAPPKNVVVKSVVLDYAADVAPALQIRSDGNGDYLNSRTLVSQVQAIGDWELDAINPKGASRMMYLDFSQPIAGSTPGGGDPTSLPAGHYKFRALAQCSTYGNSLLAFAPGDTKPCPLRIGFDFSGRKYAIVMNPSSGVNGPFPTTDFASVTCIFPTSATAPCSQWKLTPAGTYIASDSTVRSGSRAKLLEYATVNGQSVLAQDHGDFYLSFSILVAQ